MSGHVIRHLAGSLAASGFALLSLLAGLPQNARANGQTNLVYVTTNISSPANQNSVLAWSNDGAGNLTPVAGSPFLTGGTGFNDPLGPSHLADRMLIIDAKHFLLLTVNPDSNTIADFTINSDGSLTPIAGSPFPSGGQEPLSLALSPAVRAKGQQILAVTNMAADPNQVDGPANMISFLVATSGVLTPTPKGSVNLGQSTAPTSVRTVNPAGSQIAMVLNGGDGALSQIILYSVSLDGIMTQIASASADVGGEFVGAAVHPTAPVLYVGYPSNTAFDVYTHNVMTGSLSFVESVPAAGEALCWLLINSAGNRLYTVQSGSSSVTVYNISRPETPVQIQNVVLADSPDAPTELAFDPTGQFLYVLGDGLLHVLNVSQFDGTLSETVTPVPLNIPPNTEAIGIATVLR